jgi:hypothetical protein
MERVNGFAPSSQRWQRRILLLNHTRDLSRRRDCYWAADSRRTVWTRRPGTHLSTTALGLIRLPRPAENCNYQFATNLYRIGNWQRGMALHHHLPWTGPRTFCYLNYPAVEIEPRAVRQTLRNAARGFPINKHRNEVCTGFRQPRTHGRFHGGLRQINGLALVPVGSFLAPGLCAIN